MTSVYVFSRGANGGHRGEYDAVLKKEFLALGVTPDFVDRLTPAMLGRDIFFAMLDEAVASFILCALASLVFRSRTIGLLFRPGECLRRDHVKYCVKYALFWLLRRISTVRVLTILPFSVEPRFAEVAHGWVYDPQLWDRHTLDGLTSDASTPLSREVSARARGRALMVALGGQSRGKGFDFLCSLWRDFPELRDAYLVVAAGQVAPESRDHAEQLSESGGMAIDRFVSAEELSSLYAASNLVWAAYHPLYNQASGIVGRAFQFGIPVIVRQGSYMARLAKELDFTAFEISYDDPAEAVRRLLAPGFALQRRAAPQSATVAMRDRFVETIMEALKLSTRSNAWSVRH